MDGTSRVWTADAGLSVDSAKTLAVAGDRTYNPITLVKRLTGHQVLDPVVIVDEPERWKAADVKELSAYLAAPAPSTVLALVAEEIKADAPLVKAVAKAGQVLAYDVPKRKLPEWVAEQFGLAFVRVDADACR